MLHFGALSRERAIRLSIIEINYIMKKIKLLRYDLDKYGAQGRKGVHKSWAAWPALA
jgi:hypothetical protein